MNLLKKNKFFLCMLAGVGMTALTMLFPKIGFFEWATLIPFFIGIYSLFEEQKQMRYRRAYLYGFLTFFCYNLFLYTWFLNLYPLDFAGMDNASSVVVVLAGWVGLSILQALPGGLILVFYAFLQRNGLFQRAPFLRPFVLSALWVLWEWYHTIGWWGVPWCRLALGQAEFLPILQTASLFGSYAVSFLILIVNALLAYAVLYQKKATLCAVCAASILGSSLFYGFVRMAVRDLKTEDQPSLSVAIIQGNISSHEKWDEETYDRMKAVHADLTRQAVADGAELVLWAETALPYVLNESYGLKYYISSLALECNVPIIVGALYDAEDGSEYNALYYVEETGIIREQFYAKRHLVPFGEYVPLRTLITTLIPPLAEISMLEEDVTPGEGSALFESKWGKLGSLICFDSIYEDLTRESVLDGAELLLLATNDSWFEDSASVYMHNTQAQLRAIESGRWIVRSANTGVSTILSPTGKEVARIEALTEGYAVATVSVETEKTPYMLFGNLFVYLCICFATALFSFVTYPKIVKCLRKREKKI